MFPAFPKMDQTDQGLADIKSFGDLRLGISTARRKISDLTNVAFAELRATVCLAPLNRKGAVGNLVRYIFGGRSPSEIFKTIIKGSPIQVPSTHPPRAWPNVSFKDEAMYIVVSTGISAEMHRGIAWSSIIGRTSDLCDLTAQGEYSSVCRNSVLWVA